MGASINNWGNFNDGSIYHLDFNISTEQVQLQRWMVYDVT